MSNEWKLSSAMTNDIIHRNNFGSDGVKPVCIDVPESDGKRTHYAAIIVCTGKKDAKQIISDRKNVAQLADALRELVDLMEAVREGEYKPDSFTTQPARIALSAVEAASTHQDEGGRG